MNALLTQTCMRLTAEVTDWDPTKTLTEFFIRWFVVWASRIKEAGREWWRTNYFHILQQTHRKPGKCRSQLQNSTYTDIYRHHRHAHMYFIAHIEHKYDQINWCLNWHIICIPLKEHIFVLYHTLQSRGFLLSSGLQGFHESILYTWHEK